MRHVKTSDLKIAMSVKKHEKFGRLYFPITQQKIRQYYYRCTYVLINRYFSQFADRPIINANQLCAHILQQVRKLVHMINSSVFCGK